MWTGIDLVPIGTDPVGWWWSLLKPETPATRPALRRSTVPTWEPWVRAITAKARLVRVERTASA